DWNFDHRARLVVAPLLRNQLFVEFVEIEREVIATPDDADDDQAFTLHGCTEDDLAAFDLASNDMQRIARPSDDRVQVNLATRQTHVVRGKGNLTPVEFDKTSD